MPEIQIEGGEVLANLEDRTITGLVLPYNELGNTNVGRFEVQAGVIALPEDPSVMSLNVDHDRFQPVGRATRVWETTAGIMATFAIGLGKAGDKALAGIADGTRKCLSGEFTTGIKNAKATGGFLAAAGLVGRGAFPSAAVLAADAGLNDPAPAGDVTSEDHSETTYTDADGRTYRRVYDSETTETATENGTETTTITTITEEETEATTEAAPNEQETQPVTATAIPPTATAIPPTAAPSVAGTTIARMPSRSEIFAAIATRKNRLADETMKRDAEGVLAALKDITTTGTNALVSDGVVQPNWVGQIAEGVPYVREYITLCNLGTDISLAGKKGYKVRRGTKTSPQDAPFDGSWAGDKSAIKSYQGFTETFGSKLDKFAIAEDIAREFYDLPGGEEAVAAFISMIVEDHLIWSDEAARQYIVETAGTPVAPNTAAFPDRYPAALGMLTQGILAVKKRKKDGRRDTPSFAIANDKAFEQLIYAAGGEDHLPAFVSIAMSTDGTGTVDGTVHVVNGDVGIDNTPAVLVGSKYAIDFDELAGGPLRINALDIAKGGMDEAVHGYLQTFVKRPEALVLVGAADGA